MRTLLKEFLMFSLEILLLGLALALDAAVVSFAVSLLHKDKTPGHKVRNGFLIAAVFGGFQLLMLWAGSYAGYLFTFSNYGYYFQLAVGMIFFGLALKCFQDSFSTETKTVNWGVIPILIMAFITSIDALISGMSLGTLPKAYLAAIEVGTITFFICSAFYFLGQFLKQVPDRWLLRLAALIFIFLGGQIVWNYRYLFA